MKVTAWDIEFAKLTRKGHERACEELAKTPRHMLDEGNPNHPRYDLHLFGQPADEFMRRQYRA